MWTMDMNQNFLQDLTEDKKLSLLQFRARVESHLSKYIDDFRIYRILKSKQFNIDKAEKMLMQHLRFREKWGLDTITKDFKLAKVVEKYSTHHHLGYDKTGDAVMLSITGQCDLKGLICSVSKEDIIKSFCFCAEELREKIAAENAKKQTEGRQIIVIFDLHEMRLRQIMDRTAVKTFIVLARISLANYPGFVKHLYVINPPYFFRPWFNLMQSVFGSEAKIVSIYTDDHFKEDLLKTIDKEVLPMAYGGTRTDFESDLDNCTVICRDTKIPTAYYIKNKNSKLICDPATKEIEVRERTYYNQEIVIKKPNSVLTWCFQTLHYNINFAVYFVPAGVKAMPKVSKPKFSKSFRHKVRRNSRDEHEAIVPLERVESHLYPEEGDMMCEKTGTYLLHFDNTFSWQTPKTLYYKYEIVLSSHEKVHLDENDDLTNLDYRPLLEDATMCEVVL